MQRFDPKAIFIAMLLSLVLDVMRANLLFAAFSSELDSNLPPEQMMVLLLQNTDFLLVSLFLGTVTTVLGGYIAARLARGYPYFNALAIGLLGIVLEVVFESDAPGWADTIAYLVCVPAALFGGNLGLRRNE